MALAARVQRRQHRVYVLLGDGDWLASAVAGGKHYGGIGGNDTLVPGRYYTAINSNRTISYESLLMMSTGSSGRSSGNTMSQPT